MIEFCKLLYDDVYENIDDWVCFMDYREFDFEKKKSELLNDLVKLKKLIIKREEEFLEGKCFL